MIVVSPRLATARFGIFNRGDALKGFRDRLITDKQLLKHAADLEPGIVYLLLGEVLRHGIKLMGDLGFPLSMDYDAFFRSSNSVRYFKKWPDSRPTE